MAAYKVVIKVAIEATNPDAFLDTIQVQGDLIITADNPDAVHLIYQQYHKLATKLESDHAPYIQGTGTQ